MEREELHERERPTAGCQVVEVLGQDEWQVLARAIRQADQRPVLMARSRSSPASPREVAMLRHQHQVLSALSGPGIPQVLELQPAALILTDGGGVSVPRLLAGSPPPIGALLRLARQLAEALAHLHETGLIHRGMCSAALLVHPTTMTPQIVDWSSASRLAVDGEAPASEPGPASSLSPEQTGRMNRVVDHRTDLYGLGAILYELSTGQRPFDTQDPLELAHWQIARMPIPPAQLRAGVPTPLSDIVMKLLAKMAEDRYQSARGLVADLQRLDEHWHARGRGAGPGSAGAGSDPPFPLATRDGSERLTLPQRLYGRERPVADLRAGFEQAATGRPVFALVSGYAGVGKTSVVAEVGKTIAARRGRLVSGKFDQIERGRPYAAIAQALQQLVRQAMAEGPRTQADLRLRLCEALGANAGVIAALVPEIEALVGPVGPVPALGPAETHNRFALACQRLLAVFATPERPLTLFLDDLQWADTATLRLLASTLDGAAQLPVFWIGAFRDNEIAPDHPLARFRAELRERQVTISDITLSPLRLPDITAFLHESLRTSQDSGPAVADLARVLQQKTDGNPFFLIQFLKSMQRQGLLRFERSGQRWSFDLAQIERASLADNVLELMTRKLHHLPSATQSVITSAACIGNNFSLSTLALVHEQSQRATADELWEAITEGLVLPTSARYEVLAGSDALEDEQLEYRFLHDRVQQAAYALIPEDRRTTLHLRVGRLLLDRHGGDGDHLFEIAGHMNRARQLITDPDERRRLAALDLSAGRKARAAGAVQTALDLFQTGRALLPAEPAGGDELTWTLDLDAAECQLLTGQAQTAERMLDTVVARAPSLPLQAEAHRIRVVHLENSGRFSEGARVGLEALARLGFPVPEQAAARAAQLQSELQLIDQLIGARPLADLASLATMDDPAAKMAAVLTVAMWPAAFLANEPHLTGLLSARLVRLSLERGNTEESAIGYLTHAITVNAQTRDYQRGHAFAQLGLAVNDRFGDVRLRAKAHHLFGSFLSAWGEPLPVGRRHGQEAHRAAVETGDFTYAGRAAFMETWYAFFPGEPLEGFEVHAQIALAFLERIGHAAIRRATQILVQWGRALRGRTRSPLSLTDDEFDEAACAAEFQPMPIFQGFLGVAQLGLAVTFGDARRAWCCAQQTAQALSGSAEQIWHSQLDFLGGLAAADFFPQASETERPALLAALEQGEQALRLRAGGCPENFEQQHLLLGAERARLLGQVDQAEQLFERASAAAERAGYPNDQAAVHERRGRFLSSRGDRRGAQVSLQAAQALYQQWGAVAKVRQLQQDPLLAVALPERALPGPSAADQSFDAASALKAAQAIAAELEITRLLPRLVHIVIENAGAERGVLIEAAGDSLVVRAQGTVAAEAVPLAAVPLAAFAELPHGVIQQVHRSRTALMIGDARSDPRWRTDEYVRRRQPRSMLCVPMVRQGTGTGVLYLENTLSAEVFTPTRAEVVQVLASQAAISLENARLYQELAALTDRLKAENVYLQEEIRTQHNFEEIVGSSPELMEALRKVEKVAPTDSTVLVLGETGTGKELVARAIHSRSTRRGRPLVKVNCAAIATGLVESELFGHVKGAFTGALQKRVGRFELADGGTIFLDEVGELPLDTQAKLLRVLQEHEFEPVGASRTQKVDVRVIAATNRDLDELVRAGRFRTDLLYRLNVFPLPLPPLRRRRDDIPLLVGFLLASLSKRLGRQLEGFRREDMERLQAWSWPGNVRELQNVVERAAILAQGSVPVLGADLLPAATSGRPTEVPAAAGNPGFLSIEDMERRHIVSVLESTSWVVEGGRGAASILGLHPNTLRSRMKKLGITRSAAGS